MHKVCKEYLINVCICMYFFSTFLLEHQKETHWGNMTDSVMHWLRNHSGGYIAGVLSVFMHKNVYVDTIHSTYRLRAILIENIT